MPSRSPLLLTVYVFRYVKKIIYAPGRLWWCSNDHAFASGPILTFNTQNLSLKRNSIFNGLYDQTVQGVSGI